MIRKEKIEQMKVLISQKQQEIRDLRQLVGEEMIADFYETHNLNDKECVGVEMSADWGCLKTFPITAKGEVSKKGMIIHSEESIKPV